MNCVTSPPLILNYYPLKQQDRITGLSSEKKMSSCAIVTNVFKTVLILGLTEKKNIPKRINDSRNTCVMLAAGF